MCRVASCSSVGLEAKTLYGRDPNVGGEAVTAVSDVVTVLPWWSLGQRCCQLEVRRADGRGRGREQHDGHHIAT